MTFEAPCALKSPNKNQNQVNKTHSGSLILVYLAFIQVLSVPRLLNSSGVHHAATYLLLVYEALLGYLLLSEYFREKISPHRFSSLFEDRKPRFWTRGNKWAVLILPATVVASFDSHFLAPSVLLGAILVLGSTVALYRQNLVSWRRACSRIANNIIHK